jgi:hypothetical protein
MALASKQLLARQRRIRWDASEALAGVATIGISLDSGTGTVVFEARVKGSGNNWQLAQVANVSTGALVTSATASGLFRFDLSGQLEIRVRMSVSGPGVITVYPGVSLG